MLTPAFAPAALISAKNAREVFDAGVDVIVAGSSVFCAENQEQAIIDILNA